MNKMIKKIVLCLLLTAVYLIPTSVVNNQVTSDEVLTLENSDVKHNDVKNVEEKNGGCVDGLNDIFFDQTISSPGDYFRFVIVDGRIRSYRLHIPLGYDGENPVPIVFSLHGHGANAWDMKRYTELGDKSDEEGFIVVFPNGHFVYKGMIELLLGLWYGWNFWENQNYEVDDVNYIRTLIQYLQRILNVNSSRIYITGGSGGACMAYRLGAELSDVIAAIAPLAGTIGGKWGNTPLYVIPEPSNPLPVVVFHGMQDKNVPYNGGWADGVDWLSVNESVSFWVEHNNCDPVPLIETSESGNIITRTYVNGDDGSEIVLYSVVNGGHEWFGSPFFPLCEISATDLLWEFFERHPKQT